MLVRRAYWQNILLVGGFAYENSVWITGQRAKSKKAKQHANGEVTRQCVNNEAAG